MILAAAAIVPTGVSYGQFTLSPLSRTADRTIGVRVPAAPDPWIGGLTWMCAADCEKPGATLSAPVRSDSAVRDSGSRALAAVADTVGARARCAVNAPWMFVRFHGWLVVSISRPRYSGDAKRDRAAFTFGDQSICEVDACPLTFADSASALGQAALDPARLLDSAPPHGAEDGEPDGRSPGRAPFGAVSRLSAAAM